MNIDRYSKKRLLIILGLLSLPLRERRFRVNGDRHGYELGEVEYNAILRQQVGKYCDIKRDNG